jgi:NADPH:quinone reductase-like Zn-dependent oxidoreductase
MNEFLGRHKIEPVISHRFTFDHLPEALRVMKAGGHFGKIVVTV